MGKGNRRSKRGKIWRNSYGKTRGKDNRHQGRKKPVS